MTTIITTVTPMLMTTNDRGQDGIASEAEESAALFRLMTWLSPSFPVGSFSYSSGIEWAVEAGDIADRQTLQDWLAAMLLEGAGFCDGLFLCHAWRAAEAGDGRTLGEIAELAAAFMPSRERHLETTAQGRAFVEIARSAWNCGALDLLSSHVTGPVTYPVAVGVLAAGHRISLASTLHAFLHATTSNWISAGVRLIPLGQTDSQHVLAALEGVIAATAEKSLQGSLDDLGSATFRADLASMRHETQYTRLFRS
ncbi:MAG: urease accessory protein UreF [Afipia sp.]|nr:urease accessory protein UreF [Afipia sp.]